MKSKRQIVIAVTFCLFLLAGYPLSLGPALWLSQNGGMPEVLEPHVFSVYIPVLWVVDRSETLARAYAWYISLWWEFRFPAVAPDGP